MRCGFIKDDGKPCRAFSLKDDPEHRCLFHTQDDACIQKRRAGFPLSQDDLIKALNNSIRRVARKVKDPLERSRELRNLIAVMTTLQGGEGTVELPEFEKRVEKWQKKTAQQSSRP